MTHAEKRSLERYGVEPDKQSIIEDILGGKSVFLTGNTKRSVFAVLLDGKAVPVVYDKKYKDVVTILPRKMMYSMLTRQIYKLKGLNNEVGSLSNHEG